MTICDAQDATNAQGAREIINKGREGQMQRKMSVDGNKNK